MAGFDDSSPFLKKLTQYSFLTKDDIARVEKLCSHSQRFNKHEMLMHQGEEEHLVYIMLDGWAFSYRLLSNGRRLIIDFAVPGDLLGGRSLVMSRWLNSGMTLTEVEAIPIPSKDFLKLICDGSPFGIAILMCFARDDAISIEHMLNVARRSAIERTAHLILELACRLKAVGLGDETGFYTPISQEEIADALGLTSVHINRVLRQLRQREIATVNRQRVTINDIDTLQEIAGFDFKSALTSYQAVI